MRRSALMGLLVAGLALLLAGCPKSPPPETPVAPPRPSVGGEPTTGAKPSAVTVPEGGLPKCDPGELAAEGYRATVVRQVDLDGDDVEECIIGYQFSKTDEMDEPVEIAYFAIAKWDGAAWGEWFSIPGPDGEKYCDESGLLAAEDLNGDGVVELVLRFAAYGVSSRPENIYVWQVKDEGLEPAADREPIESSSDEAVAVKDYDLNYPGKEIYLAVPVWAEGEAHLGPHRHDIVTYGWSKGKYRQVDVFKQPVRVENAEAALNAFFSGRG